MIRIRRGVVREILAERPGATELTVELEGGDARALCYPALTGPARPGDRVVLNTTAVHLGLGTGGVHFVMAIEGSPDRDPDGPGHLIKARYTPTQVQVEAFEETGDQADAVQGVPVVWIPLHSMLGPVAAGARAAGADRVAYVMTDHAALPAAFSRSLHELRSRGLIDAVVTAGQAFGGDLEAVSVFSGLLGATTAGRTDVIVIGDGPGSAGTATTWGASSLDSAASLNAAGILGGRPVAALRVSFADARERHVGVSHHSLTALSRVVLVPAHIAVPVIDDEDRRVTVWEALRAARLEERHQLVEATGQPALELLASEGITPRSMGRTVQHDPEFFLAAGAAGVLAGRMASRDRAWRRP
ncbi:MAG TPA: DUF3866 family protein [Actinomycetota bacterium]|nr:DUF3866 family protein [Actinomycetota bacterium]